MDRLNVIYVVASGGPSRTRAECTGSFARRGSYPARSATSFARLANRAGTLRHLFGTDERVYILKIPFKPLQDKIRWESPDAKVCGPRPKEGLFPYLYDEKLGKDEVECVITLNKGSGWNGVMENAKDWLVY